MFYLTWCEASDKFADSHPICPLCHGELKEKLAQESLATYCLACKKKINFRMNISNSNGFVSVKACVLLCAILILTVVVSPVAAQEAPQPDVESVTNSEAAIKLERLQSIGDLLVVKRQQRNELTNALKGSAPDQMQDERERLIIVKQDLESLRSSFDLALLDGIDTNQMDDVENADFNWRVEIIEIVEPLLISLKSLTKRPRQLAALRKDIEVGTLKLAITEQAHSAIDELSVESLNDGAKTRLAITQEKWTDAHNLIEESLISNKQQLARLENNGRPLISTLIDGMSAFATGRGLTLLITLTTVATVLAIMRACWYLFNNRLVKRTVRRKAMWYRVLAYSYHLFTFIIVVSSAMVALYVRQDVLLIGLAFLIIGAVLISLRHLLPRVLTEVRLLLNLGAVREDELVMHAGLPWQVMSLNILSVLRNPALEGIIRLPLDVMAAKVSRPVLRDEIWFPSNRGDFIIMPDQMFGEVNIQTPEMVEISVKGGRSMTFPTAEYFCMSVQNLSRHDTFGIPVTFGLDYSLLTLSHITIPESLRAGVVSHLNAAGFQTGKDVIDVLSELESAGASSLDFLVYVSIDSSRAADFYVLRRIIHQACVAVADERQWTIPFPQMTLHHCAEAQDFPDNLQRAA